MVLHLADIYGPSEGVIGKYLQSTPEVRSKVQVLTKFCCFGQSMDFADNPKYVKRVPLLPFCKACCEYVICFRSLPPTSCEPVLRRYMPHVWCCPGSQDLARLECKAHMSDSCWSMLRCLMHLR